VYYNSYLHLSTNKLAVFQSPDGKYIACGAIDGIINIFDVSSGKLMHTLEGHAMPVRFVSSEFSNPIG